MAGRTLVVARGSARWRRSERRWVIGAEPLKREKKSSLRRRKPFWQKNFHSRLDAIGQQTDIPEQKNPFGHGLAELHWKGSALALLPSGQTPLMGIEWKILASLISEVTYETHVEQSHFDNRHSAGYRRSQVDTVEMWDHKRAEHSVELCYPDTTLKK